MSYVQKSYWLPNSLVVEFEGVVAREGLTQERVIAVALAGFLKLSATGQRAALDQIAELFLPSKRPPRGRGPHPLGKNIDRGKAVRQEIKSRGWIIG